MRDIWNPWHGCTKKSEGCRNCYMYFLDAQRGRSGAEIFRVKNNFDYPLHKDKNGFYKIKSGEFLRVCMTSDFFIEEADDWRSAAWDIMKIRSDVVFILVTKRPERIEKCLPDNWKDGWENIWLNVTTENQVRVDERVPILLELQFKHKGIMVAPFIGEISLAKYLSSGAIENVWCGGENYDGARPLHYSWVKRLSEECKNADVTFSFFETGNIFIKDNRKIRFTNKIEQSKFAYMQGLNYESSKLQIFDIDIDKTKEIVQTNLFQDMQPEPFFRSHCEYCLQRRWCSGCSNCGKCDQKE